MNEARIHRSRDTNIEPKTKCGCIVKIVLTGRVNSFKFKFEKIYKYNYIPLLLFYSWQVETLFHTTKILIRCFQSDYVHVNS